jgi:hypothetical protein
MQITTMKYNHLKNLGSVGSSALTVEVVLNEGDDAQECFKKIKAFVHNNLQGIPVSEQVEAALAEMKGSGDEP